MTGESRQAADVLAGTRRLMVVTGAGMSRDSGVPTFRDSLTGLWSQFDPQELATEQAFRANPSRVFGWYLDRWRQVRDIEPHPGYHALTQLREWLDWLTVATQNVDGLHATAGNGNIIELHGLLSAFRCLDEGHPYDSAKLQEIRVPEDGAFDPPECPQCGSPIRPGVVWFGEALPADAVQRAWSAADECDSMLVVGTSSIVYPAAELPEIVLAKGCPVVEINPTATPLSGLVSVSWRERAAVALPALVEHLISATARVQ